MKIQSLPFPLTLYNASLTGFAFVVLQNFLPCLIAVYITDIIHYRHCKDISKHNKLQYALELKTSGYYDLHQI